MATKFKLVGKLPFISKKELNQTKDFDKLMSRIQTEKVPESAWSGKRLAAIILAGALVVSLSIGIYQIASNSEQLKVDSKQVAVNKEIQRDHSNEKAKERSNIHEQETIAEEKKVNANVNTEINSEINSENENSKQEAALTEVLSKEKTEENVSQKADALNAERVIEISKNAAQLTNEQTSVLEYEKAQPIVGFDSLYRYFASTINYPDSLRPQQIYGKVVVEFVINKSGKAEQVKVLKSLHPDLDNEAIRMVEHMPDWTPTKVYGEPIASKMSIPITFQLK